MHRPDIKPLSIGAMHLMTAKNNTPPAHVVIVGGGFGGLYAARTLARANVRITLIDRRNHHLFQPLLYQVATAGLSAPDIAAAIRQVMRAQKKRPRSPR